MEKFYFIDAQQRRESNPKTFYAPIKNELHKIVKGDYVKVGTEFYREVAFRGIKAKAERFWCEVQSIEGDKITGIVKNDLIFTHIHGFKCEQTITFEKKNILDIDE